MGVSRTRKTTLTNCILELPPIVIKSCAGHDLITLWDIFMILDQVVEDIE